MKFLFAFALLAVAYAVDEVQVVDLPAARAPAFSPIDIRPLIVPQSVIDALKIADVVNRDAQAAIEDDLKVRFVDAAETAEDDIKVRFVDAAELAEEILENAAEPVEDDLKVRFVDVAEIAEEILEDAAEPVEDDLKVRFVDAAEIAEDDFKVRFVDVAEIAEEILEDAAETVEDDLKVRFVDAAVEAPVENNAEVEQDFGKVIVFDSPAEALVSEIEQDFGKVNFVDAAVDDVAERDLDSLKVKFVDTPAQAETIEAVKIAEPVLPSMDAVKVAEVPRYLGKVYTDPRLR